MSGSQHVILSGHCLSESHQPPDQHAICWKAALDNPDSLCKNPFSGRLESHGVITRLYEAVLMTKNIRSKACMSGGLSWTSLAARSATDAVQRRFTRRLLPETKSALQRIFRFDFSRLMLATGAPSSPR
mmetsp:Transcript_30284/g.64515  ORF Transcript_30284/g.64515 Transcript_30284/m.64515 type:complete len:129 (-) Transcript_30284:231-617(-)